MLRVDLQALHAAGVEYFTGNCHKWLCGPRGTAFLWIAPDRKSSILPAIVSHGSGCGFTSDFSWDGNRDYSGILGLSAAVAFHKAVGMEAIQGHMSRVMLAAVGTLTQRWGTATLAPAALCPPGMSLVQLPATARGALPAHGAATSADAKHLQDFLFCHGIEVPVKCVAGSLYLRLSVHVYNEEEEYCVTLAEAVHKYCQQERPGGGDLS
mmetsp:Transcript_19410/g.54054  ORF Transcript_19410/g.54054 Transcript_19410/m.54054 type:complete len:210 (-) Transcript_19410:83-712(-)